VPCEVGVVWVTWVTVAIQGNESFADTFQLLLLIMTIINIQGLAKNWTP